MLLLTKWLNNSLVCKHIYAARCLKCMKIHIYDDTLDHVETQDALHGLLWIGGHQEEFHISNLAEI